MMLVYNAPPHAASHLTYLYPNGGASGRGGGGGGGGSGGGLCVVS